MSDDPLGLVKDAPSGQVPFIESRFASTDIRLSSALCPLGFFLKLESQPVSVKIDAETTQRVVTFFHNDETKLGDFSARDVSLWWTAPSGKFTIEGYDDALYAMRRVHAERARMLNTAKRGQRYSNLRKAEVATQSLNEASMLGACDMQLNGYDPSSEQWVFSEGAEILCRLIKTGGRPSERPLSNDLCIDWMIETLRYRDWLAKIVRNPNCIPLIEMRNGERILQISQGMNEKDAARLINRL